MSNEVIINVILDEETGGIHGMKPFVNSKEFQDLNIGFDLDEGTASETNSAIFTYGGRVPWRKKSH